MRNFKVYVNGNEYEVAIEEVTNSANTSIPENRETVKNEAITKQQAPKPEVVAKPQAVAKPTAVPKAEVNSNGHKISAPFPGVILKALKNNGEKIKKGEVLFVLEAMKMENDIASPADGTLSNSVQAGTSVETGTVLAVIS
jgi:biotin carboxyl carrier protein